MIVRGNHIRNAAFSAIRGNAASNIQIIGNNCGALDEVAIYAEFDFEGAVIADNMVDGAALGISVTNFNDGGRLAVVQGNLIRNLKPRRPQGGADAAGVGIGVEADTAVTGNVIENAPFMGISVGCGPISARRHGQRQRRAQDRHRHRRLGGGGRRHGRASPATPSPDARRGAIVGMDWHKAVTGDLALAGAERYPQLRSAATK